MPKQSDTTNYMPIQKDGFDEGDYHFDGWQPRNADAERLMIVQAFKEGEFVKEIRVPMLHPNSFGIDMEDMANLEKETAKLVRELTNSERKIIEVNYRIKGVPYVQQLEGDLPPNDILLMSLGMRHQVGPDDIEIENVEELT